MDRRWRHLVAVLAVIGLGTMVALETRARRRRKVYLAARRAMTWPRQHEMRGVGRVPRTASFSAAAERAWPGEMVDEC